VATYLEDAATISQSGEKVKMQITVLSVVRGQGVCLKHPPFTVFLLRCREYLFLN
jgi:hypothetical protein